MLITNLPETNINLFDCLSAPKEIVAPSNRTELLDYMVTVYPRYENSPESFQFVYALVEPKEIAFAKNQATILNAANVLFNSSEPLTEFEQSVLVKTFDRLVKSKPTLPGRK